MSQLADTEKSSATSLAEVPRVAPAEAWSQSGLDRLPLLIPIPQLPSSWASAARQRTGARQPAIYPQRTLAAASTS